MRKRNKGLFPSVLSMKAQDEQVAENTFDTKMNPDVIKMTNNRSKEKIGCVDSNNERIKLEISTRTFVLSRIRFSSSDLFGLFTIVKINLNSLSS
jgi:hypothetical protein